MKPRTFILFLFALPAWGQSLPPQVMNEPGRPLNLSLPQDMFITPAPAPSNEADAVVERNLRQGNEARGNPPEYPRYGAGYEARQQGVAPEGGRSSPMGRGSRGGMRRGR